MSYKSAMNFKSIGLLILSFTGLPLITAQAQMVVAVIDTGVEITHLALASSLWTNQAEALGIEGVDEDGNGYVDDIHGYNFVDDVGTVTDLGPHAVDNGAKIINCSWGEELKSPELEEAITYALLRDVVIVASAGNLGINNDFYFHYPSHHAGVITVANLDGSASNFPHQLPPTIPTEQRSGGAKV